MPLSLSGHVAHSTHVAFLDIYLPHSVSSPRQIWICLGSKIEILLHKVTKRLVPECLHAAYKPHSVSQLTAMKSRRVIALLHGPDAPGIVAHTANWIFQRGGNILHADQHRDNQQGIFFQRIEWTHDEAGSALTQQAEAFEIFARDELGMHVRLALSDYRPKVVLMVSKIDHCFHDAILRFVSGELPGELVGVISNHTTLQSATERYGLPFHHTPITGATKLEAEQTQSAIIRDYGADLVILARYMQILSDGLLGSMACPVINIHHSFLPAFAGGKPYHQAYERGVKLIGATAHYATADLDEGPIIAQDVKQISHRHTPNDLVRHGRDLEKSVFARAIRLHLEHRLLVYSNKTVVFD